MYSIRPRLSSSLRTVQHVGGACPDPVGSDVSTAVGLPKALEVPRAAVTIAQLKLGEFRGVRVETIDQIDLADLVAFEVVAGDIERPAGAKEARRYSAC